MVADLIYLGANVNETNNAGKSCLHLSAESGYIRVLEVRGVISHFCLYTISKDKEIDCMTVRLLLGFCFCFPIFLHSLQASQSLENSCDEKLSLCSSLCKLLKIFKKLSYFCFSKVCPHSTNMYDRRAQAKELLNSRVVL